jgi:hypothetical protein
MMIGDETGLITPLKAAAADITLFIHPPSYKLVVIYNRNAHAHMHVAKLFSDALLNFGRF